MLKDNLIMLRKLNSYSQEQIAEKINISRQAYAKWESGATVPDIDRAALLARVYGVSLDSLMKTETADEAYKRGVEMTFSQLMDVFKKLGVEEIESVGKPFDPAMHNAVMHVEDAERGENEIVEEFQKGFKIGDKVIRFSMVKVAN